MPHLTIQCTGSEPIFSVGIGVSRARAAVMIKAGQPIPEMVVARGFIDTGASLTGVDYRVLDRLGIRHSPTGMIPVQTPSTSSGNPHMLPQYDVGIVLVAQQIQGPNDYKWCELLAVTGNDFSGCDFDVLIGRDVLANCVFVYDGGAKSFILAF